MRKRFVVSAVLGLLLGAAVCLGLTGDEAPFSVEAFVLTDMPLISYASRSDWTEQWTPPVEAATIMGWLHLRGYSQLLLDLNADSVINDLDMIELADRFGKGPMKTPVKAPATVSIGGFSFGVGSQQKPTTDALLVYALAQYVAAAYPNDFELKIYDQGFPAEFQRDTGIAFTENAVPGIRLVLKPEPSYEAYRQELVDGEAVIVGIEEEVDQNYYFTGRSFVLAQLPDGTYAVDLAWAEEDNFRAGFQGQVLETKARQTDALYLKYGPWMLVEFMLALSPIVERAPEALPCGKDQIAIDVHGTQTVYGTVQVEECVTRTTDEAGQVIDTYCYTVTNQSYVKNGCGICWFAVPNTGGVVMVPGSQSGGSWCPNCLWPADGSMGWEWSAPGTSCGIQIGQSATFCFSVYGKTEDVVVDAMVGACPILGQAATSKITTTGPKLILCPNVVVMDVDASCDCADYGIGPGATICTVTVDVWVKNNGTADIPATQPFDVCVTSLPSGAQGDCTATVTGGLVVGGVKKVTCTFECNDDCSICPDSWHLEVRADCTNTIEECDESDNSSQATVCCEAGCPYSCELAELVITSVSSSCTCGNISGKCELRVSVKIENQGCQDAGPFNVRCFPSVNMGWGPIRVTGGLASGASTTVTFMGSFSCGVPCTLLCSAGGGYTGTVWADQDDINEVQECDEANSRDFSGCCTSQ